MSKILPIGSKYNLLTVTGTVTIERLNSTGKVGKLLLHTFICDCGNTTQLHGSLAVKGKTKSCGCLMHQTKPSGILPGTKYGSLTVVKDFVNNNNHTECECICECGNIFNVSPRYLVHNMVNSCGCSRSKNLVAKSRYQIGTKIGGVTIISWVKAPIRNHYSTSRQYLGKCDCGKEKIFSLSTVSNHHENYSCGCFKKEATACKDIYLAEYKKYIIGNNNGRKLEFSLTEEEFTKLVKGDCFYCGENNKTNMISKRGMRNGIDRVNPKIGYILSNCVSCCKDCNSIKFAQNLTEFKQMVSDIYHHYNKPI